MPDPDRSIPPFRIRDAELAALADGSLSPERRRAVASRVAADPELRALVAEQDIALRSIRAIDVAAPPSLVGAVQAAERTARRGTRWRRRRSERARTRTPRPRARAGMRWLAPVAAVAVGAAAAAVAMLPGSASPREPSVVQAAALGGLPATGPGPTADRSGPGLLVQSVDRVPFPDWSRRFHLTAVGQRADEVGLRQAKTIFYSRGTSAHLIGYTIVAGPPLGLGAHAVTTVQGGVSFHALRVSGRSVLTWERGGHTCILSSSGTPPTRLLALANSTALSATYRASTGA